MSFGGGSTQLAAVAAVHPAALPRALFGFAGRVLSVDAGDTMTARVLDTTYAGLKIAGVKTAHHVAALRRLGDGGLHVRFDRRAITAGQKATPEPLLSSYYALKEVFARFAAAQHGCIAFYGALMAVNSSAVLVLGPTSIGKTVLALHMADLGARFLGDETAVLDPRTGTIRALPRRPALRDSALPFVPSAMAASIERAPHDVETPRGRFWYALNAQDLNGIEPSAREQHLAAVCVLRERSTEPAIVRAETARALPSLLQRTYARPFQLLEISAFQRTMRNVAVFDVTIGQPRQTAELILEQLRACV